MLLDAKASITIINFGWTLSTIPFKISTVSIPVVPKTPGETALTGLVPCSNTSGIYVKRCLVISISCITFGPKASGVTYRLPNPTTKISSCGWIKFPIKVFNSFVTASDAFCISSSPAIFKSLISIVI